MNSEEREEERETRTAPHCSLHAITTRTSAHVFVFLEEIIPFVKKLWVFQQGH